MKAKLRDAPIKLSGRSPRSSGSFAGPGAFGLRLGIGFGNGAAGNGTAGGFGNGDVTAAALLDSDEANFSLDCKFTEFGPPRRQGLPSMNCATEPWPRGAIRRRGGELGGGGGGGRRPEELAGTVG